MTQFPLIPTLADATEDELTAIANAIGNIPSCCDALNAINATLSGITAMSGPQGIQGEPGEQGPQGPAGADGGDGWGVWTNVSLTSKSTQFDGSNPARVRVSNSGKNGQMQLTLKPVTSWVHGDVIATVHLDARPLKTQRFLAPFSTGDWNIHATITNAGNITLWNIPTISSSDCLIANFIYALD